MAESRKEYLREQVVEQFGEEVLEQIEGKNGELSERDLEMALRMKNDRITEIAVLVRSENFFDDLDEEHLSEETKKDVEDTRRKLNFNKAVVSAHYDMPWEEIRDLFHAGDYETLEEEYDEELDNFQKWMKRKRDA